MSRSLMSSTNFPRPRSRLLSSLRGNPLPTQPPLFVARLKSSLFSTSEGFLPSKRPANHQQASASFSFPEAPTDHPLRKPSAQILAPRLATRHSSQPRRELDRTLPLATHFRPQRFPAPCIEPYLGGWLRQAPFSRWRFL